MTITSKPTSPAYRSNYDKTFKKGPKTLNDALKIIDQALLKACEGHVGDFGHPPRVEVPNLSPEQSFSSEEIKWKCWEVSGIPVYKDSGVKELPYGGTFPDQDSLQEGDKIIVGGTTGWFHAVVERRPSGELFAVTEPGNQSGFALGYSEEQGCWASYGQVNLEAIHKLKLYAPSEPHQVSKPIDDGKVVVLSAKEYEMGSSRRRFVLSCRHVPWLAPDTAVGSRVDCPLCVKLVGSMRENDGQHPHAPKAKFPMVFDLSCGHVIYGKHHDARPGQYVPCPGCREGQSSGPLNRVDMDAIKSFLTAPVLTSEDAHPYAKESAEGVVELGDDTGVKALMSTADYEAIRDYKPIPTEAVGVTMTEVMGMSLPNPELVYKDDDGVTRLHPQPTPLTVGIDFGTGPSRTVITECYPSGSEYCPACGEALANHQMVGKPPALCCHNCGATLAEILDTNKPTE